MDFAVVTTGGQSKTHIFVYFFILKEWVRKQYMVQTSVDSLEQVTIK